MSAIHRVADHPTGVRPAIVRSNVRSHRRPNPLPRILDTLIVAVILVGIAALILTTFGRMTP